MSKSRLQRLKQLSSEFKRSIQMADYEKDLVEMLSIISDMTIKSPLDKWDKLYKPESHQVQVSSRMLLEYLPIVIYRAGKLEEIYSIVEDPQALTVAIHSGLLYPNEEGYMDMAKICISLGGVVGNNYSKSIKFDELEVFRNDQRMPPRDTALALITNQIESSWSLDQDVFSSRDYSDFVYGYLGYAADDYPSRVLDLIFKNAESMVESNVAPYYNITDPILNALIATLRACSDSGILSALCNSHTAYFDELLSLDYANQVIRSNAEMHDSFKISSIPVHELFTKDYLLNIMLGCISNNKLTQERLSDLRSSWKKQGYRTDIVSDFCKSKHGKWAISHLDSYRRFLFNENTNRAKIQKANYNSVTGFRVAVFDSLVNEVGTRIVDDKSVFSKHCMMAILHDQNSLSDLDIAQIPKTPELMSFIVLVLSAEAAHKRSKNLLNLIDGLVKNKDGHTAIRHFSSWEINAVKNMIPSITDEDIRTVNWDDNAIKGDLLSEGLGL